MTVGEIARAFDMTTKQFAAQMGYSRQALHQKDIRNTAKFRTAIRELKDMSARMLIAEHEHVKQRCEARMRAVDELEKLVADWSDTHDG